MTMIDNAHAPEWHSISEGPDAELAELRRALAAAELRAITAVQAEDVAQFAFETAKRRADTAEAVLHALLIEHVIEPLTGELDCLSDRVDTDEVPDSVLAAIADDLIEELHGDTTTDELHDIARDRLQGWAEEQ